MYSFSPVRNVRWVCYSPPSPFSLIIVQPPAVTDCQGVINTNREGVPAAPHAAHKGSEQGDFQGRRNRGDHMFHPVGIDRQTNCMKWLCKGKMKKWGFLQLYSSHLNETCILGTLRKKDLIRISLKDMRKARRKEGRKEDALLPAETGQADFLNKQGLDKSTANNLKLYKKNLHSTGRAKSLPRDYTRCSNCTGSSELTHKARAMTDRCNKSFWLAFWGTSHWFVFGIYLKLF